MRPSTMPWTEGQDGLHPAYSERLFPRWWVWTAIWFFIGCVSIAYGSAFGTAWAVVIAGLGVAASTWALVTTSPVVRVDERVLRVGRARLPRQFIADVEPLGPEAARDARSLELDPRSFLMLRTWSTGTAMRLRVSDPRDPHPTWLFSTKHPRELALALQGWVEEPGGTGTPAHSQAMRQDHDQGGSS